MTGNIYFIGNKLFLVRGIISKRLYHADEFILKGNVPKLIGKDKVYKANFFKKVLTKLSVRFLKKIYAVEYMAVWKRRKI